MDLGVFGPLGRTDPYKFRSPHVLKRRALLNSLKRKTKEVKVGPRPHISIEQEIHTCRPKSDADRAI